MKRRTLDVLFSAGGIALAGLLLVLGLVMTSNANFAKNYVKDQLSQQNITFKTGRHPHRRGEAVGVPRQVRRPAAHHRQAGRVLRQRLHRPAPQVDRRRPDLRRPRRAAERARGPGRRGPAGQRPRPAGPAEAADDHHGAARDPLQGRDPPRPAADLVRVQRLRREGRAGRHGGLHRRRAAGAAVHRRLRPRVQDPEGQGLRGACRARERQGGRQAARRRLNLIRRLIAAEAARAVDHKGPPPSPRATAVPTGPRCRHARRIQCGDGPEHIDPAAGLPLQDLRP